eukprot:TRINITY_DN24581_c0_g1_i1.p1 TRINITY_DN24581_c0_g1~~TRINITY_DN24581_c0_g1_i1.p1  ORF type:complete len:683 (+),score=157.98 TRINITY_DN24581_c0_g1_i1:50-2098(+)
MSGLLSRSRTKDNDAIGTDPIGEAAPPQAFAVDPPKGFESVQLRRSRDMADLVPVDEAPALKRGRVVAGLANGPWVEFKNGLFAPRQFFREVKIRRQPRAPPSAPKDAPAQSPSAAADPSRGAAKRNEGAQQPDRAVEDYSSDPIERVDDWQLVFTPASGGRTHAIRLPVDVPQRLQPGTDCTLFVHDDDEQPSAGRQVRWQKADRAAERGVLRHCDLSFSAQQGSLHSFQLQRAPQRDPVLIGSGVPATGQSRACITLAPVQLWYQGSNSYETAASMLGSDAVERAMRQRVQNRSVAGMLKDHQLRRDEVPRFLKVAKEARCGDYMSPADLEGVWEHLHKKGGVVGSLVRAVFPPGTTVGATAPLLPVSEILDKLTSGFATANEERRKRKAEQADAVETAEEEIVEGNEGAAFDDDKDDQFVEADQDNGLMDRGTREWGRQHEGRIDEVKSGDPADDSALLADGEGATEEQLRNAGIVHSAEGERLRKLNEKADKIGQSDGESSDGSSDSGVAALGSKWLCPLCAATLPSTTPEEKTVVQQHKKTCGRAADQQEGAAAAARAAAGSPPQGTKRSAAGAAAPASKRSRTKKQSGEVGVVSLVVSTLSGKAGISVRDLKKAVTRQMPEFKAKSAEAKALYKSRRIPQQQTIQPFFDSVGRQVDEALTSIGATVSGSGEVLWTP